MLRTIIALGAFVIAPSLHAVDTFFVRADANADGEINVSDATFTLGFLFLGFPREIGCLDAADANDDGAIGLADAVFTLSFLFLGSRPPAPPFEVCGRELSTDDLGCIDYAPCETPSTRFEAPVDFASSIAFFVGLADLNLDGALDAVTANGGIHALSVFLGTGTGSFSLGPTLFTVRSSFPYGVAIGDLNEDGYPDLAAAHNRLGVDVFLSNGAGGFETPTEYPAGEATPAVALGDLTGDGHLDLISADRVEHAWLRSGRGDGSFGAAIPLVAGTSPFEIELADFDHDGTLDIAVAAMGDYGVSVLLGEGDGSFLDFVTYPAGCIPWRLEQGDLDLDGNVDLVVASSSQRLLTTLQGRGDGSFELRSTCLLEDHPLSLSLADIDGDGRLDAVLTLTKRIDIYFSSARDPFHFLPPERVALDGSLEWNAVGDLNGDGRPDVIVANRESSRSLRVLLAR